MSGNLTNEIIKFIEEQQKSSFSIEEISEGLHLNKSEDFKLLVQTIAAMEREKRIEFTKKGKIKLPQSLLLVEGIFRANERGFGFVTIDPEENDVFVPKENTNYALDGDTVKIDIVKPADPFGDRGAEGKVMSIEKRALTQLVGEFVAFGEAEVAESQLYGYLIPKDKKLATYKVMIVAEGVRPVDGSICQVEILHYPGKNYARSLEGMVKQVVGHKNDPGMDILSIVIQHGIPTAFPEEVIAQANAVPDSLSEKDYEHRKDLRDQLIVTIDGEDAKDLDDAVTVKKLANGHFFLGVHIADVSHYVTEGSPLDQEAYERGTSVYLTDRVIPMLPQRLSNGICSLNPKVPRLTKSCEMEIDERGEVVHYTIFESVIQTTARMTYTAVNAILETKDEQTRAEYAELVPMFEEMGELHGILESMREQRGAISFEDREAKILVDANGLPQDVVLRSRGLGERLIESFMLAANETVAKHFHTRKLPFIYRIHEQPKEEKMQRFFEFATNFGILVKGKKEDITPKALQAVLAQVKDKPEEPVINTMLLRSMQQARYSEDSYGHYGLAAEYYTHFTSPIRRYPDLIVHRLIRAYQESTIPTATKEKWAEQLPDIADHSSKMERRSVDAERETDAMKKAEYMVDKVDAEFDGVISSITKFGIFVELANTIEGLIHLSTMKEDYFHYLENHLALVGERTGVTYKIGQKVRIKVTKADPETREIDFELLSAEAATNILLPKDKKKKKQERNGRYEKEKTKRTGLNKKKGKKAEKPFYKDAVKKKKRKRK